ncbi:MAG TPA: NAD-dependent epimerase/dehydratase family protein [Pyrinomonadaceae bacterium]|nr:NAD-dependent epimerase/dehydratase family protein [Pyrinomonadaceae bacterium]
MMPRVTVIGSTGFVGSAFVRYLKNAGVELREVTRQNYDELKGIESDVVIESACNSKKFLAEKNLLQDFELSVTHRLRTLQDFPANFHLHISSVDVYSDLTQTATTKEDIEIDLKTSSHYGFNKLLAEQLVEHHAKNWLILRLAGMIGEGLRKNPIFDILNDGQIFIHPDSQYQFMPTDEVARIAWSLVEKNVTGEIFNLCGDGLISPREIAKIAGKELLQSDESKNSTPRIVTINNEKIKQFADIPKTQESVAEFIKSWNL